MACRASRGAMRDAHRRARRARGAVVPAQSGRSGHELSADHDVRVRAVAAASARAARDWLPRVVAPTYDRAQRARRGTRRGNTIGMGMTEKQGGSDVRANTTRATPVGDRGPGSSTSSSGTSGSSPRRCATRFLVLAQTKAGLSCFLLPRFAPDGTRNAMRIQRLKDKLGDWSNASSEVEFQGALAWMVGDRRPRRRDDPRDGGAHAAGLHDRLGEHHAAGARAGGASRAASPRVRQAAASSSR